MENANRLYDAVFSMLGQHRHWRDVRHLKTLCWMVVGLRLEQPDQLNGLAGLQERVEQCLHKAFKDDFRAG